MYVAKLGGADQGQDLTAVLERALAGSPEAFEVIYQRLAPSVAGYLRFNGASDVDALTNEVLTQVHLGLPRFTGDWAGFRAWVFTIAHRRMVDDRRRRSRRPVIASAQVSEESAVGDVEEDAFSALGDERLRGLLEQLSPDQREVLLLRIVADLPLEEVAETLGKTVGAVKSLQHRALASLRRVLEREGADLER